MEQEQASPEAVEEAFDLDAAVEDFATNAPDEWKGKAQKLQSELKGLRGRSKEWDDRLSGFNDNGKQQVAAFFDAIRSGNPNDHAAAAKWAANLSKELAGEKFAEIMDELTPKQQEEVAEKLEDAAEDGPLTKAEVAEIVAKAIEGDRQSQAEKAAEAQKQQEAFAQIEKELEESNLKPGTMDALMVLNIASADKSLSIKAAAEQFETWKADLAKEYLKGKEGGGTLGGDTEEGDQHVASSTEGLSPKEKALARISGTFTREG